MTTDHGPFETAAEAMSTEAGTRLREDIARLREGGYAGMTDVPGQDLLIAKCREHGVDFGAEDLDAFTWTARGEMSAPVCIAYAFERFFQAGRASRDEG